jgi:hypothetical protein
VLLDWILTGLDGSGWILDGLDGAHQRYWIVGLAVVDPIGSNCPNTVSRHLVVLHYDSGGLTRRCRVHIVWSRYRDTPVVRSLSPQYRTQDGNN